MMSLIKINLNFNIKELDHTLIWIVGIHIADTVILRKIKTILAYSLKLEVTFSDNRVHNPVSLI